MNMPLTVPAVTVRREIEASADELFDAWLDPESLAEWMRPAGGERSTATVDPSVGGAFEIIMMMGGQPKKHSGVYVLIDRPRRLVFTWISPHTNQQESLVTVDFEEREGVTEIVITHEKLPDQDAASKHTLGWTRILELLEEQFGD